MSQFMVSTIPLTHWTSSAFTTENSILRLEPKNECKGNLTCKVSIDIQAHHTHSKSDLHSLGEDPMYTFKLISMTFNLDLNSNANTDSEIKVNLNFKLFGSMNFVIIVVDLLMLRSAHDSHVKNKMLSICACFDLSSFLPSKVLLSVNLLLCSARLWSVRMPAFLALRTLTHTQTHWLTSQDLLIHSFAHSLIHSVLHSLVASPSSSLAAVVW